MADDKTTVQISNDLRKKIKLLALCDDTTYESVLDKLVEKEISKRKLNTVVNGNILKVKK